MPDGMSVTRYDTAIVSGKPAWPVNSRKGGQGKTKQSLPEIQRRWISLADWIPAAVFPFAQSTLVSLSLSMPSAQISGSLLAGARIETIVAVRVRHED
jgi:hypothetical protein